MSVGKIDYISILQTLLVFSILKVGNIAILVLWRDREKLY